jgi:outer membrane protein assembly factor BamB
VATLEPSWTARLATNELVRTSPIVSGMNVYVGHTDHQLYVFSVDGERNCSGEPEVCAPLWTSPTGGPINSSAVIEPIGTVFVGSDDGKLYAFDADGLRNCSGTPLVCHALWTAQTGGPVTSPLLMGDMLYATSDQLYAFDAFARTNCSGEPEECAPLWTAPTGAATSRPALAGGLVYVTAGSRLLAFDAAGVDGCSGDPRTCEPVWVAEGFCTGIEGCTLTSPVVGNGTVFVGSDESDGLPADGRLYAFDADGVTGCSGTPTTCTPRWSAPTRAQGNAPAVARGRVYVTDFVQDDDLSSEGRLLVFDAAGIEGCGGEPVTCAPRWQSDVDLSRVFASPTVANGVVYVASALGRVRAFDAAGVVGCSASPPACAPLWTSELLAGAIFSSPVPANGRVYINERGALRVFVLPS